MQRVARAGTLPLHALNSLNMLQKGVCNAAVLFVCH
jgi:hypothetical protein